MSLLARIYKQTSVQVVGGYQKHMYGNSINLKTYISSVLHLPANNWVINNGWKGKWCTDLINILKCIDDIIRQAGEQVNHKPGLQVIHADQLGVRDHLPCRPHKGGVEIEHNVNQKNDIYNAVHY